MSDTRPTWQLVLEAARELSQGTKHPFALAEVIRYVQSVDPARGRTSIQPVVQGMTRNAGIGPPAPCGKVLERVAHGVYSLESDAVGAPSPMNRLPRPSRAAPTDVTQRLSALAVGFDSYVDAYDLAPPFVRVGQLELHRKTIERRRELGSVPSAVADPIFTDLLRQTLYAWGIGKRRSRLAPLAVFRHQLERHASAMFELEPLELEKLTDEVAGVIKTVNWLIENLGVVDNEARIVAGTKTLHHVLPDLIPPMDRAWTGAFFNWSAVDPQYRQAQTVARAFEGLGKVARRVQPSRLVGAGWRTSATKVVDNALIGFCRVHGIEKRG